MESGGLWDPQESACRYLGKSGKLRQVRAGWSGGEAQTSASGAQKSLRGLPLPPASGQEAEMPGCPLGVRPLWTWGPPLGARAPGPRPQVRSGCLPGACGCG